MKSFMLITGLLLSVGANVAFSDELSGVAAQQDLADMLRQQSEVISLTTQERASAVFSDERSAVAARKDLAEIVRQQSEVISLSTQERASNIAIETPLVNDQPLEAQAISAAVAQPRALSRALLLASLQTSLLQ